MITLRPGLGPAAHCGRLPLGGRLFALIAVLALLVVMTPPGRVAAQTAPTYVALGDSDAAGPGIPVQYSLPCLRSDHNYPHVAAAAIGLNLVDVSCSGATIADMAAPQTTWAGPNPPQLAAITRDTHVVSLSIGTNDINLGGIFWSCTALTPFGPTAVGRTCTPYFTSRGQPAAAIAAIQQPFADLLRAIRQRAAADLKIFVVGYAAVTPAKAPGCWPFLPYTAADLPYFGNVEIALNAMLRSVTTANGGVFVDQYAASLPYNACTNATTRWVEPFFLAKGAMGLHLNANGMSHIAAALVTAMRDSGVR